MKALSEMFNIIYRNKPAFVGFIILLFFVFNGDNRSYAWFLWICLLIQEDVSTPL